MDLYIFADVLIVLFVGLYLFYGLYVFSESKKKNNGYKEAPIKDNSNSTNTIIYPHITVVFDKDISDDDVFMKEVADMYISNRIYYYTGKIPSEGNILPEKEGIGIIKYDTIDFSSLMKVDV